MWIIVGLGPNVFAFSAGGGFVDIFLSSINIVFSLSLSLSLWQTVRKRLKYCLKGPLNVKQSTEQPKGGLIFVHVISIHLVHV